MVRYVAILLSSIQFVEAFLKILIISIIDVRLCFNS